MFGFIDLTKRGDIMFAFEDKVTGHLVKVAHWVFFSSLDD